MCKRSAPEERDELDVSTAVFLHLSTNAHPPQQLLTTRNMEESVATAYYRTNIEQYVPTQALKSFFGLPFRVADRFIIRPQKILIQAIIRDGGRKRRIVLAGTADSATPNIFQETSDAAHPFADYFHTPVRTPFKSRTLKVTTVESDSYPDKVWDATPKSHAIQATPTHTPIQALLCTSSPFKFDRGRWAREDAAERDPEYTQDSLESFSPSVSDANDHLPLHRCIPPTYGSKAETVYNDSYVVDHQDHQLEKLKELKVEADAVQNGQDSVLETIMTYDESSLLLEELSDVGGLLEDRAYILEHSMLSLQLAKELVNDLPTDLTQPPISPPSPPLQPSATISLPPLVAPLAEDEFQALAKLAHEYGTNPAAELVKLSSTALTSHDFGTLLPRMFNGDAKGWLNDNIINEYLELLLNDAHKKEGYVYVRGKGGSPPPVHAFKSQWYLSMVKDPQGTARWARPVHLLGEKLFACSLVLIPICHHSHWRLLAIKPKERLIEYYDSLHGSGGPFTQLAKQWVQGVLQEHFVEAEWSISEDQKSEEQANASDCGIFTLLNALVLLRGEEHNRVEVTNGMDDARLRVAATLLAKTPTTEMN
jgi:hypothetical protein